MGLMKELNDLNAIYLKMHEQEVSEDQDKGYVVTAADKKGNTPAWQGYKAGKKNVKTGKPLYRAADHLKKEEAEVEVDESVVKGTSTNAAGEKIPWKVTTSGGKSTVSDKYGKRDVTAKVRQPKKVAAPKGSKMKEEVEVDESIGSAIDKGLSAGADVAKVAGKAAVGGVKVASKVVKKTAGAAGRVVGTAVGAVKSAKKGYKGGAAADEEVKIDAIDHYLNELKKTTLASYAKKATTDLANRSFDHGESEKRMYEPDKEDEKEEKKQASRKKSIDRAIDKLAKEEFEVTPEFLKLIESGLFSDEELIKMIEGYQRDPEQSKKDRHHSKQPDPSKVGFTGIGNMSIDDIMKMNAKIKAKAAKKK